MKPNVQQAAKRFSLLWKNAVPTFISMMLLCSGCANTESFEEKKSGLSGKSWQKMKQLLVWELSRVTNLWEHSLFKYCIIHHSWICACNNSAYPCVFFQTCYLWSNCPFCTYILWWHWYNNMDWKHFICASELQQGVRLMVVSHTPEDLMMQKNMISDPTI